MNRRNFLKTIGVASITTLIPFNLKAEEKKESVKLKEPVKFFIDNDSKFNMVLNESVFHKNDLISTTSKFIGKNTKEKLEEYYKRNNKTNVWFYDSGEEFHEDEILDCSYEYRFYGCQETCESIGIDCKLDNKYKLRHISFNICGISQDINQIYIFDYPSDEKYKIYPIIYNYYSKQLFGLTFEEINNTNIKSILLPEKMFEENKKYIPIIEKETRIKFTNVKNLSKEILK